MWTQIDDTPVWMIGKSKEDKDYQPVLVAWYNQADFDFLTSRSFGTKDAAFEWLQDFWDAYWRLAL